MAKTPEIVGKVLEDYNQDKGPHDVFIEKADRCYNSYRSVLESRSEAADWTNKQHPAYVLQSIETMAANLLAPSPKWRLRAFPKQGDPAEIEKSLEGAKANENLLQHQITLDHWAEKQRIFDLQGLIVGLTAAKQFWNHKEGTRKRRDFYIEPVHNLYGQQIGERPADQVVEEPTVLRDDPTSEVVDVRHLIWQQGCSSLAQCSRVTHRVFYSYDKLLELEKQGVYGPQAGGQPVSSIKEKTGNAHRHFQREQSLFDEQPHKDDIELLEQWREGGKRVVTLANEATLLADKPNPFWFDHLEYMFPFVVCSGMPDLFRIPGISEAELMAELQEMLWTLINQRLDNLQLINNAIFLVADDAEDPDAWEFGPGERWLVPRPVDQTIKPWSPDYRVAEISLRAEAFLRGDVQNITGGMPFLSGTETQGVDQQTATGVSIITSLAQKRLAAKRQQFLWAKARIGEQWCALNQQYVRKDRLVPIIGMGGSESFEVVRAELLQGDYIFETEMAEESLLRAERRTEATTKFQVAVGSQGVMAASGVPWNLRAHAEDVLEAFDISDKDRYFASTPPQGQLPGQQQPPGQPEQNGQGVTNPQLAAGPTAPSNALSVSPEAGAVRLMGMRGVNNA